MKRIMSVTLACLITASAVLHAQERITPQPLKPGETRDFFQLDPRPFDPLTEPDGDMFMRHYSESAMTVTAGCLKEWQILYPLKGGDPAYPEARGYCTTRSAGLTYAVLAPGKKTDPVKLTGVQKLMYVAYGSGEIVSGTQRETFRQDAMMLVPVGATYTLENTGARDLILYTHLDPVPAGFKPRADILVRESDILPFGASGGEHWTHSTRGGTISTEDGLATITHMAPVWYLPNTLGQPHAHNPGLEEIWFVVEGDFHLLLGKQFYNLLPGTAYKVPPTGTLSHSNMNLGDKPLRTVWMMYSVDEYYRDAYRYGTLDRQPPDADESNPDMYISGYQHHYFKTVHSFLERDMLAKNTTPGARPVESGEVLNYIDRFTHATIVGHQKTVPVKLTGTQEVYYILSGTGTITGGGRTYDLFPGACALVPAGLEFSIANDNDEVMTMYLVAEKVTPGFTPNTAITVKDEKAVTIRHQSHWTYESRLLFERSEGLSQLQNVAMVLIPPNSFAQPHSHGPETEEVWSAIDADLKFMLGKHVRTIAPGSCYMVPPDGTSFHANINTTGSPVRTFYFGMYDGRK